MCIYLSGCSCFGTFDPLSKLQLNFAEVEGLQDATSLSLMQTGKLPLIFSSLWEKLPYWSTENLHKKHNLNTSVMRNISYDHTVFQAGRGLRLLSNTWLNTRPELVVQGSVQTGLENLQGWRPHNLSRRVPPLTVFRGRKCFPVPSLNPSGFNVASCPPTMQCWAELGSIFSMTSLQVPGGCCANPGPTASPQSVCAQLTAHHPCRAFPTALPRLSSWGVCLPGAELCLWPCWILEGFCQPCLPSLSKILLDGSTDFSVLAGPKITEQTWLEETLDITQANHHAQRWINYSKSLRAVSWQVFNISMDGDSTASWTTCSSVRSSWQ